MNKSHLKLFDKISAVYNETSASSGSDADRIYELVSQKIDVNEEFSFGRNGSPRVLRRPVMLAAAVCAVLIAMTITTVAYYMSVSDAFRETLREYADNGETVPISEMAPIVDKSGALIDQTSSSDGIDITLRAIVGDKNGIKILLDITDVSGTPLGVLREDGTYSDKKLYFGRIRMRSDETRDYFSSGIGQSDIYLTDPGRSGSGGYGYSYVSGTGRVNDFYSECIPDGNKAEYLLEVEIGAAEKDMLIGKTLYLELDYILQSQDGSIDFNYENSDNIVSDGYWTFEFTVNLENNARVFEISEDASLNGLSFHAGNFEISPYYMTFSLEMSNETMEAIREKERTDGVWGDFGENQASLTMKDGSVAWANLTGRGGYSAPHDNINVMDFSFRLNAVIDPEQIETIEFFGTVFEDSAAENLEYEITGEENETNENEDGETTPNGDANENESGEATPNGDAEEKDAGVGADEKPEP